MLAAFGFLMALSRVDGYLPTCPCKHRVFESQENMSIARWIRESLNEHEMACEVGVRLLCFSTMLGWKLRTAKVLNHGCQKSIIEPHGLLQSVDLVLKRQAESSREVGRSRCRPRTADMSFSHASCALHNTLGRFASPSSLDVPTSVTVSDSLQPP